MGSDEGKYRVAERRLWESFALDPTESVRRVVLYSWSMGVPMDHTPLVMRFAGIPGIGKLTARMPINRSSAKMMLRQVGLKGAIDSGKFTTEMLDWFVALLRYTPTLVNEIRSTPKVITPIKGINQAMLFTDELLARVTSPVHCFWGEDDPNGGAETAKQFVARLPHGTLELVPDAGHAPWIDETARATASTLAFLNGECSAASRSPCSLKARTPTSGTGDERSR